MSQMVGAVLFMNKLDVQKHQRERGAAGCGVRQNKKKKDFKIWTSFVFIHSIKLSLRQWPQCGNESGAEFWCPESDLGLSDAELKRNPVLFSARKRIQYILYTVQEVESRALVRDQLCSASLISWLTSSQDRAKEVCPTKLSLVFKKAPRALCRGHIYDPKLRWRVWNPSRPSGLCILLEHNQNQVQRCVEAPRDTSARARVCVNTE